MNQDCALNGTGPGHGKEWPDSIVISHPDSAFEIAMIPLDDDLREALTAKVDYLKPPRLPRPDNLRWWERLAWAWRGL
jgi:hypothetical protein